MLENVCGIEAHSVQGVDTGTSGPVETLPSLHGHWVCPGSVPVVPCHPAGLINQSLSSHGCVNTNLVSQAGTQWKHCCSHLLCRSVGTSMMIEDVVCPVEHLADMTADLIQLFKDHGYRDASAVGHALEGNLHLVFSQVRPASSVD